MFSKIIIFLIIKCLITYHFIHIALMLILQFYMFLNIYLPIYVDMKNYVCLRKICKNYVEFQT